MRFYIAKAEEAEITRVKKRLPQQTPQQLSRLLSDGLPDWRAGQAPRQVG